MDLRSACKLRDATKADSENQRDATGRPPIKIPSLLLLASAIMREQKIDANDCIGKSALKSRGNYRSFGWDHPLLTGPLSE